MKQTDRRAKRTENLEKMRSFTSRTDPKTSTQSAGMIALVHDFSCWVGKHGCSVWIYMFGFVQAQSRQWWWRFRAAGLFCSSGPDGRWEQHFKPAQEPDEMVSSMFPLLHMQFCPYVCSWSNYMCSPQGSQEETLCPWLGQRGQKQENQNRKWTGGQRQQEKEKLVSFFKKKSLFYLYSTFHTSFQKAALQKLMMLLFIIP